MSAKPGAVAAALAALLGCGILSAQDADPNARSRAGGTLEDVGGVAEGVDTTTPRLANGRPDFSGLWLGSGPIRDISLGLLPGEEIVLLPEARALMESRMSREDPEANCLPTGVPRIAPYPWRFVRSPLEGEATHLYMLFEGNIHSYRQVFVDGREHGEDLNPTWYGHSIGHWEGDTLVIDTIGFNDRFWFDFAGHPHTEQLHTIERYTRPDLDTMEIETTINDPGAYAKPFTVKFSASLRPDWELMEYICNENNQDVEHLIGPPIGAP